MRLVDADKLLEAFLNSKYIKETTSGLDVIEMLAIKEIIDNAPTIEPTFKPVAEVKFDKEQLQEIVDKAKAEVLASVKRPQGEWIDAIYTNNGVGVGMCNQCGFHKSIDNFCPNCGADMRGEEK